MAQISTAMLEWNDETKLSRNTTLKLTIQQQTSNEGTYIQNKVWLGGRGRGNIYIYLFNYFEKN